jgi:hypothetical protein
MDPHRGLRSGRKLMTGSAEAAAQAIAPPDRPAARHGLIAGTVVVYAWDARARR